MSNDAKTPQSGTAQSQTATTQPVRIWKVSQGGTAAATAVALNQARVESFDPVTGKLTFSIVLPNKGKRASWIAKASDVDKGRAAKIGDRVLGNKVSLCEPIGRAAGMGSAGDLLVDPADGEVINFMNEYGILCPMSAILELYYTDPPRTAEPAPPTT